MTANEGWMIVGMMAVTFGIRYFLFALADRLYPGMNAIFDRHGFPARCQGLGARFGLYFGFAEEVRSYPDTAKQDAALGLKFFAGMTDEEIGDALGVSAKTVRRDWSFAKACTSTS